MAKVAAETPWVEVLLAELAALPVTIPIGVTDKRLLVPACVLMGITVVGAGTAGGVELYAGEGGSGQLVAALGVAASTADERWFGPNGKWCPAGLSWATFGTAPSAATAHVVLVD